MVEPARLVSARLQCIPESATLAITAKAKQLRAAGETVIGFGAGDPEFPTPDYTVKAAQQAVVDTANHRYTAASGLPELRQAIADKTLRDSGVAAEASQVIVTNGGKQAVYNAFAALTDPGDEILLPAPYWTTYPVAIKLAGGTAVDIFAGAERSEEHTSELQSRFDLVCRLLLEKKKKKINSGRGITHRARYMQKAQE